MVRAHHGYHAKGTRGVYRKKVRQRGLPGLSRFMIEYDVGDKVNIVGDSSFQKGGLPHRRFWGRTGIITEKRGRCYEVEVKFGKKIKKIYLSKAHMRLDKSYLASKTEA
jgi:large subunit ribosomal protein L21e